MEVFGDEQQCACYKECQEFQKLVEFKDSGLVVYCPRPRTQDITQAEAVESAGNTSRDAFIFCNKKDVKITTSELTSELEKETISCPRCRKIFEHAQKLIQEVKSIDKKMVLDICDHCRKKAPRSKQPFCVCDKIVKKFISVKGEQKEETKKSYKTLPLKMGHLRKDTMVNKENRNSYFDFQIDRGLDSPASRHEPEIQQMFSHTHFKSDDTELGKTDLKEGYVKQAVAFTQPIEPVIISSAHTPHEGDNLHLVIPGTPLVDSATTFGEISVGIKELPRPSHKYRKQREIFKDIPSMDAKEALKRRHDFSLRQMMRLEKDSGVSYSVSKRPDIYETPKIAPWTQKEPTSKYYGESEMDMKIPTLRHDRGPHDPRGARDLDYVSNRDVKFRSRRAIQDSFIAPRKADKYHHNKIKQRLYDPEEEPKQVKKLEDRNIVDEGLKLQRRVDKISHKMKKPEQHVAKSKSGPIDSRGNVLKHHYKIKQVLHDSEEEPKQVKKLEDRYIVDEELTLQRSVDEISHKMKKPEQHVAKSKSGLTDSRGNVLKHQYKIKQVLHDSEEEPKQVKKLEDRYIVDEELKSQRSVDKISHKIKKPEQHVAKSKSGPIDSRGNVFKHQYKIKEVLHDSEEKPKKVKKLEDRYIVDEDLKLHRSVATISHKTKKPEQHVVKSKSKPIDRRGNVLDYKYSFFFPKVMEKEEKKREINISSSHLIKDTQEKFRLQAESENKRQEEERQKKLEQAEKKKLAREEKRLQAEEKKRPAIEDQKKYEKEQRKLEEEQRKLVEEQRKLAEEQKKLAEQKNTEKDLESKPVVKKKNDQDKPRRDKSEEKDEIISKSKVTGKMPETDSRDKTDAVSEKNKIQEYTKDVKAKPDTKGDDEQKDKGVAKEQKIKPEKEDLHDKLQREKTDNANLKKNIVKLRKEKEARKAQDAKELDALSKNGEASKKTRDDAIKVSISKIQKSLKKETSEKQETIQIKHGKGQESDTKGDDEITEKESDHREKTDGVSKKGSKILLSETEQEDSEKAQTDLKAYEQKDKGVAKEQKIKPEKEDLHDKLQREKTDYANLKKNIVKLRKEKEARKAQDAKELDALSKKGEASKKTRDDAIKVSISKIQKSLKKETSEKQETLQIKHGKGQESDGKTLKKEPSKTLGEISKLQKLQAEHLKEKEKDIKKKKQLEYESKVAKAKEEAERNAQKVTVEMKRIKILKEYSDENLQVLIKQAAKMGSSDNRRSSKELKMHKCLHQHSGKRSSFCYLCANSELELEVLSLDNKNNLTVDKTDIIIGEKIFKHKQHLEKIQEPEGVPILFQKEFCVKPDQQLKQIEEINPQEAKPEQKQILLTTIEMEQGTGVIHYALSDRTFIDKGWTMLPTEKVMRKMNVYRMRPAHPEFNWFEHNKNKGLMLYDTGERLAEFDDKGRGRWYYRNGRLALDYYDAEETNTQQRFVIYSSGEPDERGRSHPITILATFDYQGNGIVFDHSGKIRLKYNQTEGVVLDRGIGPVSHWKWHSLNDPPVLQQVMIDTQMEHKDPFILKFGSAADKETQPDNEEMLAIEFDNFIKEKSKKLFQQFKPFQIRMKALKINEHFSLRVLDQATVYLTFRDGSTNLKLNIGMILDHQEIVDTDTAEVGEVSNSLERLPARTDSLAGLQRSVAHAQRYERQHAERERWLRPTEPCASADQLTAAASPPMRLPLRTVPTRFSSSTGYSSRKPRNNLYYDSRLRC